MGHWLRWLASLSSGVLFIASARWLFSVATPQADWLTLRRWCGSVWSLARHWWRRQYVKFGPVTVEMQEHWRRLRERYQTGGYGVQGT